MQFRLTDPEVWKSSWNDALSARREFEPDAGSDEAIARWNQRAIDFPNKGHMAMRPHPHGDDNILNWLKSTGALKEGMKVLDLGAGGGRFTIQFAEMGCDVTALEPAETSANRIKELVSEKKFANVKVIQRTWQSIDLDADGMRGEFDLVFASMTPGISTPDDLIRMVGASKGACYLSGHTMDRWRHMQRLWPQLFGEPMPEFPGDFLFRYGLLYTMGYLPQVKRMTGPGGDPHMEKSKEQIKADILWSFGDRIKVNELTAEQMAIIDKYVAAIDPKQEVLDNIRGMGALAMQWFVR